MVASFGNKRFPLSGASSRLVRDEQRAPQNDLPSPTRLHRVLRAGPLSSRMVGAMLIGFALTALTLAGIAISVTRIIAELGGDA